MASNSPRPVWRVRALLFGAKEKALQTLFADLLSELKIELEFGGEPFDVVMVVVHRDDVHQVLRAARARADGAPVIAILPFASPALRHEVLASGATGCLQLDSSIADVAEAFLEILSISAHERFGRRR